jgi:hypothetical protein
MPTVKTKLKNRTLRIDPINKKKNPKKASQLTLIRKTRRWTEENSRKSKFNIIKTLAFKVEKIIINNRYNIKA